ncbi:unnamed protein product [Closterium sp. NIES-64]|nr:unnamed protein product [Closterium sp. NIES-64]CAI5963995.1 unnamed protein product [Closterium sp. NIES-65]
MGRRSAALGGLRGPAVRRGGAVRVSARGWWGDGARGAAEELVEQAGEEALLWGRGGGERGDGAGENARRGDGGGGEQAMAEEVLVWEVPGRAGGDRRGMGDGSDGVGSPEERRRQQSKASRDWRSRGASSGAGSSARGSTGGGTGEGIGGGSSEEMLVPSAAVLLLQGLTAEARWQLVDVCTQALLAQAGAIDSKARQLSQQDWSTYCTDVIGRAVLSSASKWQQQLMGSSGRGRGERGGEVAAGASGAAAAVGDAVGWGSGGEQEGLRGGGSEADGVAVGEWAGREWWVQGEVVRGAVEDGRWALYCHLLDHLRFTRHDDGGSDSRIARVVLDDLVVEMAEAALVAVIEVASRLDSRQWMGLSLPALDSLDSFDSLGGGYSGGSRGTGMVGLRESQGGIGGWEVDGEGLRVAGQGRGGSSSEGGVSMGNVLSLFREEYRSSRRFEKFRNEVALRKWLRRNVTSVVAIFEDRFLLWGLRCSSPLPMPLAARPALSQQQQHASQLPPASSPNDFLSACSATARSPLLWLQGLLRIGRASSTGGVGSSGSGMGAAVQVGGAGVGEEGGMGPASGTRPWWQRKRRVGEQGQQGRVGGPVGLVRRSVVGSRRGELRQLRGWKLLVVVALELSDLLIPLMKAAITAAGRAVSFLLVALIGRSLGLVYRGIRQSWGQAL